MRCLGNEAAIVHLFLFVFLLSVFGWSRRFLLQSFLRAIRDSIITRAYSRNTPLCTSLKISTSLRNRFLRGKNKQLRCSVGKFRKCLFFRNEFEEQKEELAISTLIVRALCVFGSSRRRPPQHADEAASWSRDRFTQAPPLHNAVSEKRVRKVRMNY